MDFTSSPPTSSMDQLPDLQRGVPWPLLTFCEHLHQLRSHTTDLGITSVQHWSRHHEGQDSDSEFLIFEVVPLRAGTNTPQWGDVRSTYLEISRSAGDNPPWHCLWGPVKDEVTILGNADEAALVMDHHLGSNRLATMSWTNDVPNLLDVLIIPATLSVEFPYYTVYRRACYWYPRAIYDILAKSYLPVAEDTSDLFRKVNPEPPRALVIYSQNQAGWSKAARGSRNDPTT